MDFRLSGVGRELESPCTMLIEGDVTDATRAAIEMLDRHPSCDEVEIFTGSNFVRDVGRSPRGPVAQPPQRVASAQDASTNSARSESSTPCQDRTPPKRLADPSRRDADGRRVDVR